MELHNKTYHHGNLREALLAAALDQLRDSGTETLSLRALARSVGVSQTAPYRHFADKCDLLAALAASGHRRLLGSLEVAEGAKSPCPERQTYAFAHCYIDFAATNPELFKLMFGPALQDSESFPDLHAAKRDTFERVRQIMRHGIELGRFRALPVDYLANVAWAGIHGLATLRIDVPSMFETRIDLARQTDLGIAVFLAGVANPQPGQPSGLAEQMLSGFGMHRPV